MTVIIGKYVSDAILNWEAGSAMPAAPANLYAALLTAMPTRNDGTGLVEVSGGSYARVQVTPAMWAAITTLGDNVTEQSATNADVTFPTSSGSWGTVVGCAVYDASSTGHLFRAMTLTGGSQVIGSGVSFKLPTGNLIRQAAGA